MSNSALHHRALHRLRRLHGVRRLVLPLDARVRALARTARRGPALVARFAAVLDGRTLNIDIPVPGTAAEQVTAAELRILRRRSAWSVPARIRSESDGSCSVAATVVLSEGTGGLGLRPGPPWLVEAVMHTDSGTTSYAVLAGTPAVPPAGPTAAAPPDATTGNRYVIRATRSDRLGVTVLPPAPTAEVAQIDVDWLGAQLRFRLLGCEGPVTGVEFTARSGEGRVRAGAGNGGRCEIPVRELARIGGAKETFFDVHVRVGNRRLRAGRFLHDVRNPKPVLLPPAGVVWGAPGLSVNVRPYYTPAGNLTVACRPIGPVPSNGES